MRIRTALIAASVAVCGMLSSSGVFAAEKSTWETVKEKQLIRMGCINAEPWGFKDPKSGEWMGLGPGFVKAIAEEMKVKWECVETTWGTAIAGLQANQFDVVSGFDPTPQRALSIDFANGALVYYAVAVLAKKDINATNWSDLNKDSIRVAVPLGTSNDLALTNLLPKAQFTRAKGSPEAISTFVSGRADVVGGSSMWLLMQNHALGNKGKVVIPKPVSAAIAGIGVRQETDKRWRDWLSVCLEYYYWRGTMVKVYEDFLRFRGMDPKDAPPIRLSDM